MIRCYRNCPHARDEHDPESGICKVIVEGDSGRTEDRGLHVVGCACGGNFTDPVADQTEA